MLSHFQYLKIIRMGNDIQQASFCDDKQFNLFLAITTFSKIAKDHNTGITVPWVN